MNIEEFYAENEQRRASAEVELGKTWTDGAGARFELSFVEATGELYLMSEPTPSVTEDPVGDVVVNPLTDADLVVEVLGTADNLDAVHAALEGWEDAVGQDGSLAWLRSKLAAAGIAPLA